MKPTTVLRAAVLLTAIAAAAAAPATAVTIDDLSTPQATLALSVPPDAVGDSVSSTASGAGILGSERELELTLLADAGSGVTTEVAGDLLTLTAGTGARGQVVATWNGVAAAGLGGVDLTDGGTATGCRLAIQSSTAAGAELMLEVSSNGTTDVSRAALVLPAVAAPSDLVLSFVNDFVATAGAGADFTAVDSIVLALRAAGLTVAVDLADTVGPDLHAAKTATLLSDVDSDGFADPGDTVRFSIAVTNDGGEAAGSQLADPIDANVTPVAGSLTTTPIAFRDTYVGVGNVTLSAPAPGVLGNDQDPDGDSFTVSAWSATSAKGGSVTVAADGGFSYVPPAGFTGVDSFTYTVQDSGGRTGAGTATVILGSTVWFVKNDHGGPFEGTLANPFNTLAAAAAAAGPGDILFVFQGDGTTTGLNAGIVLQDDQQLIGEGVGLTVGAQVIVPPGSRPMIGNAAGAAIVLAANNTIRGLDIGDTGTGTAIYGADFGAVTVADVSVAGGGGLLDLRSTSLPLEHASLSFDNLTSTGSPGGGIRLDGLDAGSTLNVSGATNIAAVGGIAIWVLSSAGATIDFGSTTITNAAVGVVLNGNPGASISFDSLSATTTNGAGIAADNSGTVNLGGAANTITAANDAAVHVYNTSLGSGWTFAALSSSGSAGNGISLDAVSGSFAANGGTISGATANAFDVNGGSGNISYAGSITNASSRSVEVTNRTGGTVTLSGAVSDTGLGISLDTNSGGTVTFNGALTLSTGANPAFAATGGGTVNATGTGSTVTTTTGVGVRVENTTIGAGGMKLQSVSTGAAANGIVLTSTGGGVFEVTGNGPTNPADTTRGRVAGGGSGGSIVNTTGAAVALSNADNVTLRHMVLSNNGAASRNGISALNGSDNLRLDNVRITGFSDNGLLGSAMTGFAMQHCEVEGNAKSADSAANDEANLRFDNLFGTATVDNSLIRDVFEDNIRVSSCEAAPCGGSSLALTLDNVAVQDTAIASPGNDGLLVRSFNDANVDLTVTDSEFVRNRANGIQHNTNDAATRGSTTVTGTTLNRNAIAVNVAHQGTTHTFHIANNTINTVTGTPANAGNAVNVFLAGLSAAGSVLQGRITGNTIGNSAVADSGSIGGNGIDLYASGAGTLTAYVANNTVRAIKFNSGCSVISATHTGTVNVTVKNNTFNVTPNSGFPLGGLDLAAGAVSGDTGTMCADITGNIAFVGDTFWAGASVTTAAGNPTVNLVGYGGAANNQTQIETFLDTTATTFSPTAVGSFTTFLGAGTVQGQVAACPQPPP